MIEPRRSENKHADALQCEDCRTLSASDQTYCGACGGHLRPHKKSTIAYDTIAVFIGVGAVILYWAGLGN